MSLSSVANPQFASVFGHAPGEIWIRSHTGFIESIVVFDLKFLNGLHLILGLQSTT